MKISRWFHTFRCSGAVGRSDPVGRFRVVCVCNLPVCASWEFLFFCLIHDRLLIRLTLYINRGPVFPRALKEPTALIRTILAVRRRSRTELLSSTRARLRCRFLSSSVFHTIEVLLRAESLSSQTPVSNVIIPLEKHKPLLDTDMFVQFLLVALYMTAC